MIYKKDYMNEVKFSKQDKELYDMAWNAAIEACVEKIIARGSYGDDQLALTIMELRK